MKLTRLATVGLLLTPLLVNASGRLAADNTGGNDRDRTGDTLTPMDQSNRKTDIEAVAAIRRTIVEQERLSTMGKNIKIIANNGQVTLRGPVANSTEQATIVALARSVPGVVQVDDQLEINY